MRLSKHHGLGNDFLVLLDDLEPDPALARRLCDRRRGVGADGLIVGRPPGAALGSGGGPGPGPGVASEGEAGTVDVIMVLRNADGSRAEMSGNGIRCLGQAVALDRGADRLELVVATDAGPRALAVAPGPPRRWRWRSWPRGGRRVSPAPGPDSGCRYRSSRPGCRRR